MKKFKFLSNLPASTIAYIRLMRLDRPIGIVLLLLPCLWTLAFAPVSVPPIFYAYFICGAACMRAAGCIINDLWDRDIDKNVARTRNRPITNGDIIIKHAFFCLGILLLISLAILLQFNIKTIVIGFISIPLIISYPLMKRLIYWPQIFLGVTFNIGVLMAWVALTNTLSIAPVLMYLAAVLWTIMYDTVYAFQDIEDDMRIGVKSSAIASKTYTKPLLFILIGLQYVCIGTAVITQAYTPLSLLLFTPPIIMETVNIACFNPLSPQNALTTFKRSALSGILVWVALLLL